MSESLQSPMVYVRLQKSTFRSFEALRLDHPMWGRAKIGPLVRRAGFVVSDATVGRIIAHLIGRGLVERVPSCANAMVEHANGGASLAAPRYRPHGALGGRTPNEYPTLMSQETQTSQIC